MKCTNCGYEDGWVPEKLDVVEGEHGEFYILPINMERYDYTTSYNSKQEVSVVGCPKCGNMQIDI